MRLKTLIGGMVLLVAARAGAQQTQFDLTPHMNDAITQYCCQSSLYPTTGSLTNLGVTFSMASVATAGAPLDAWRGEYAPGRTLDLWVGMTNITKIYTIMDTRFGYAGDPNDPSTAQASLTFNYFGGTRVTQYLFGCFNTRDHNPYGYSASCWSFNGAAPAGSNTQEFASFGSTDPVVFDMQTWDLSAYSNMMLTSITFTDNGPGVNTAFLRAVTVDQVTATPEPASLVLMASGLLAIGGIARRKRISA
ncbi:MAG: PEP-CTERM sorting domain-containing protein [Gemmatimonadaceae bacterium]